MCALFCAPLPGVVFLCVSDGRTLGVRLLTMMNSSRYARYYGAAALLVATAVWGGSFPAMKTLEGHLAPLHIIALRFGLAFALLWPLCRVVSGGIRAVEWRWGLALGGLNFVAFWLQIEGLMLTSSNRNAFLTGLNVLIVPLLAWLVLRRPVGWRLWAACGMALAGVGCIFFEDAPWNWGDTLSLLCAVAFATFILTMEASARRNAHAPLRAWCVAAVLSLVMFGCAVLMLLWQPGGLSAAVRQIAGLHQPGWVAIVYLALFSSALCMVLEAWGQQRVDAMRSAIIYGMEPVFAAAMAWVLLGERLGPLAMLGVVLVVSAMMFSQTGTPAASPGAASGQAGPAGH